MVEVIEKLPCGTVLVRVCIDDSEKLCAVGWVDNKEEARAKVVELKTRLGLEKQRIDALAACAVLCDV